MLKVCNMKAYLDIIINRDACAIYTIYLKNNECTVLVAYKLLVLNAVWICPHAMLF